MKFSKIAIACALMHAGSSFAAADDNDKIEHIEVTGLHTEDASSLLRNGIELKEIARSVQILNKDFIQEVKPKALEMVLAYTSNAGFLGSSDGRQSAFTMRGFQNPPVLIDGFRVSEWGGVSDPEIYGLEQVEILKGPDSILYGESNPGGIINMRAKRPTKQAQSEVMLDFGNYGYASPRFDLNGQFSDEALFRLVGLYTTNDTHRDYNNSFDRTYIAPSVKFFIGDATTITAFAEITKDDNPADFGNVIDADGNLTGPIGQINNGPDDTMERHLYNYGVDVSHQLNENWQLNARARKLDSGYEYSVLWLPISYDPEANIVYRVPANQISATDENAFQLSTSGDFEIGGLRNRLVIGADYRETDYEYGGAWDATVMSALDWSNPDYSEERPPYESLMAYGGTEDAKRSGFFAQNYLNVTDDFIVSAGVRYDDINRILDGAEQQLDNTSFQYGATYNITDDLTVYGSYSESFSPNTDTDKFFNFLEPEEGEGYELGLKGSFSQNISFTLAAFSIEKLNVAVSDPTAPIDGTNPFGMRAAGKQEATGFEFDVNWQVSEQLSVFANIGKSETDEYDADEEGNLVKTGKVQGAPYSTASLWLNYTMPLTANADLTLGGGAQYIGTRYFTTTLETDPYTLANFYARVNYLDWRFQLNIQNAFDERYVAEASQAPAGRGVHAGDPRGIVASVAYQF